MLKYIHSVTIGKRVILRPFALVSRKIWKTKAWPRHLTQASTYNKRPKLKMVRNSSEDEMSIYRAKVRHVEKKCGFILA